MEENTFSVSMCVYGKDVPDHFDTAIDSIINQTVKPREIVITVDGPIPESIDAILEKYKRTLRDSSISFKVVRLKKNRGHGEARRICFENCSYSLIALMDADDISTPDRFEKELFAFSIDTKLSVVGSHVSEFIGAPENIIARRIVRLNDKDIKEDLKTRCPMNQPTVMFKKEDVAEVGGYIDWFCNEDYYLWIRLTEAGKKFHNIDDCLVNMRVDEDSYHRRGGWKYFKSEAGIQKIMRDKNIITMNTYLINLLKRFVVQVLMPNSIRGWVFKHFARN